MGRLPRFPLIVSVLFGALACSHGCLPGLDVPANPASTEESVDMGVMPDTTDGLQNSLAVASISPPAGKMSGGEPVTVRGRGFKQGISVTFSRIVDGQPRTAVATVQSVTDAELKIVTPPAPGGLLGAFDIKFQLAAQEVTNRKFFRYRTDSLAFSTVKPVNPYFGIQKVFAANLDSEVDGLIDVVSAKDGGSLLLGIDKQVSGSFTKQPGLDYPKDSRNNYIQTRIDRLLVADLNEDRTLDILVSRQDGIFRCLGKNIGPTYLCENPINLLTGTYGSSPREQAFGPIDILPARKLLVVAKNSSSIESPSELLFLSYDAKGVSPTSIADPKLLNRSIAALAIANYNATTKIFNLVIGLRGKGQPNLKIFQVHQPDGMPSHLTSVAEFALASVPASIDAVDLDLDGNDDLVIRNSETGVIDLWRGVDGRGFETQPKQLTAGNTSVIEDLRVADINGDDYPDLSYVNGAQGVVWVHENMGEMRFVGANSISIPGRHSAIDIAKLNNRSALPDLLLASRADYKIVVSTNTSK